MIRSDHGGPPRAGSTEPGRSEGRRLSQQVAGVRPDLNDVLILSSSEVPGDAAMIRSDHGGPPPGQDGTVTGPGRVTPSYDPGGAAAEP
eukprot:473217-Hanusia_phi.AAC.1